LLPPSSGPHRPDKIKHSNYPIEKDNIGVITWQNDKVFYFIDCLVAYFFIIIGTIFILECST
jgi:hypothetical protein